MKLTLPSFKGKTTAEILEIIVQVEEFRDGQRVDELDFSETGLFALNSDSSSSECFMLPVNGMIEIIQAIPQHIVHLNLSRCNFAYVNTGSKNGGRISFKQAESLYAAIGDPRFKEITFSVDFLGQMPNLPQLIAKLQQERVNLIRCFLCDASDTCLASVAQVVSEKVTHLNISNNGLSDVSKIKGLLCGLVSKNLQVINFKGNNIKDLALKNKIEIAAIFSSLPEHWVIEGIDIKQDILLMGCIQAFTNLLDLGTNVAFFNAENWIMQSKFCVAVAEIVAIQSQLLQVTAHISSLEERSAFLTEFSDLKTRNIDDVINQYTGSLEEIVSQLPVEKKLVGATIMNRILRISRQVLNELPTVYDNISQRHEAEDDSRKIESIYKP